MKIAIIGTRGIPNRYGGFEKFAEKLSPGLVGYNHAVTVYSPTSHEYKESTWNGVNIQFINSFEKYFGSFGHFFYDYYCLKHAISQKNDIVIICGYGTSSFAIKFLAKKGLKYLINMDGLEWKRKKYGYFTKKLLLWGERVAVKHADVLIADHVKIQNYLYEKYSILPEYISYGVQVSDSFNELLLKPYPIKAKDYFLTVARDEPDNQIDEIIEAWVKSKNVSQKLVIVSNKYRDVSNLSNAIVINNLYDEDIVNALRHFAIAVIHGHKVGGTNPSLLEAMACKVPIIAHFNEFNSEILKTNAYYFNSTHEMAELFISENFNAEENLEKIQDNFKTILDNYQWSMITKQYQALIKNFG